ncbi:MAG: flagellar export chaperone FliS [Tissierellaceae bacterium]|nr:flagellar export chaperone FliS [Tissierellaceae bacterium]
MNYAYANAKDIYKNNQVTTAPKKKLLIMLYDGAIKNLKIAEQAIAEKNHEMSNTNIIKAQNIIMEFMHTLDFEAGGEIANNLYQLYDYMYLRLVRANMDKDIEGIKEVKKFLEELRDTWSRI